MTWECQGVWKGTLLWWSSVAGSVCSVYEVEGGRYVASVGGSYLDGDFATLEEAVRAVESA